MMDAVINSLPRVLVVDDDRAVCEVFCECLMDEYTPYPAHSCAEAIRQIRESFVDVAILDYNLPDGTGLSLLRELRSINPRLAAVLVSANLAEAVADANYESSDVDAALWKPTSVARLKDTVKYLHDRVAGRRGHGGPGGDRIIVPA